MIEVIKKWRELNTHGHTTKGQRLNLQESARAVGVSKKTLDDFYCQLRDGECFGFDFASNMNERIRVLRKYIR